jgi:methylenetetrahydrofolate reductase (NADPH)
MQLIRDIYAARQKSGKPVISFELFPPKTDEGDRNLLEKTLPALRQLQPDYVSVTYGAGGSTRDKTLMIVDRVQREHGLTALAHLTCVGATQDEIKSLLADFRRLGVKNILALRGDPPGGTGEFRKTEGGFEFAHELVRVIRELGEFSIGVAGFPEGHIACREGKEVDWQRLKMKVEAGADFVVTQLFFDNNDFYEFRDFLSKKCGVTVPLVAGILPILNGPQIKRFTAMCGSRLPASLVNSLDQLGDDEASIQFGIEYATQQCQDLLRQGTPGIHFYTLNKARSTAAVLRNLGLAPAPPVA